MFVECVEGEEGGVSWMESSGDRGTDIYFGGAGRAALR